jgi:hypothetical protein
MDGSYAMPPVVCYAKRQRVGAKPQPPLCQTLIDYNSNKICNTCFNKQHVQRVGVWAFVKVLFL